MGLDIPHPLLGDPLSDPIWQALEVAGSRFDRGTRPGDHVGRRISAPTSPRNSAASGQAVVNASLTLLAVSLIRTATFSSCNRRLLKSPLARGCGAGTAACIVRISQYATVWRNSRI